MSATITLTRDDPRLGGRLACLGADAPALLRVRGTLPSLERVVAVVGTRAADDDALRFAEELGGALATAGVVVISGGARGIDGAAHRGAIAAGGVTVAVLGGGLDRPYPPEHRELFASLVQLSEHPDDTIPHPGRFLDRNRVIAALADTVVVVQAPRKSGALSTAHWAERLGKRLLSVPHAPWDPRGQGCVQLLRGPARVCTGAPDVLQVAPPDASAPDLLSDLPTRSALPPEERAVLDALARRARHVDELSVITGLSAAAVQRALAVLMLMGLCGSRGDGRWSRP